MGSRKVFVVGTGRSGTHWLGWTLDEHPDVHATIEKPAIFDRVTEAALDERRRRRNLTYLLARYEFEHRRAKPRHYVDKSHPNVWHAEHLARYFPRAKFIGMRRGVYGTVASMMLHNGVLGWQRNWRRFPVPNRFLGITDEIAEHYDDMPVAAQCALRWKAHTERLAELSTTLDERLLIVDYEDMVDDYATQAHRIWDFVGLEPRTVSIDVKVDSREKWRDQLTPDDIAAIDRVVAA